jgi:hypothetical protein
MKVGKASLATYPELDPTFLPVVAAAVESVSNKGLHIHSLLVATEAQEEVGPVTLKLVALVFLL